MEPDPEIFYLKLVKSACRESHCLPPLMLITGVLQVLFVSHTIKLIQSLMPDTNSKHMGESLRFQKS